MEELKEPTANSPLEKKLLLWLRLVSQFGVIPVLFVWIYRQEVRLTALEISKTDYENKLIDCYRSKINVSGTTVHFNKLVAVLPSKNKLIESDND